MPKKKQADIASYFSPKRKKIDDDSDGSDDDFESPASSPVKSKRGKKTAKSDDDDPMDDSDREVTPEKKPFRTASSKTYTSPKTRALGPAKSPVKSAKGKLTPLETQVMAIKEKFKDTVLFVECGYKYKFFGEDAEIASKVLNIYANMKKNFMEASIPVHRLSVHLSRYALCIR